jgi:hypothetical protein
MHLSYRIAKPGDANDFAAHYRTCFPNEQANKDLRTSVKQEWDVLLAHPATTTILIEDAERAVDRRVVGCGQSVFITEQFVHFLESGLPPWVNQHATQPLPDGSWPLLSPKEIGRANGREGLHGLLTRWTILDDLSSEDAMKVRVFMHAAFYVFTGGYKLKALWVQATGPVALQEALRAGFRLVEDYADYYYRQESPSPDSHPYLLKITREEALALEGSLISHAFAYTPPRCYFKEREQEVLILARHGLSSAAIAEELNVTVWTINKRWDKIYERVQQAVPGLLSAGDAELPGKASETYTSKSKSGPQKLRVLLQYLESHPEELRPYKALK